MVIESDFSTLLVVVVFAAVLIYQASYLRNKQIGYFSLVHVFTLILVPGALLPLGYSYLQSVLARPLNQVTILPDGLLVNVVLLSFLFAYGGVAVHEVTKMLSQPEMLRYDDSKAAALNKYFHLSFSHNMAYMAVVMAIVGLTLLELNHLPAGDSQGWLGAVVKGVVLGGSLLVAFYIYTRSDDAYTGRWYDLRWAFGVAWLGFALVLYGVRKLDPTLRDYELLIPALLGLIVLLMVNIVLVVRRLKRGRWRVKVKWERLSRLFNTN
jgi:hypothetical protein